MVIARGVWFLIPVLGVLELALHWTFSRRAPDAEAWAELPALVERVRQPGDLVVVAPAWAEPIARHTLGDEVMPLADVTRADTSGYRAALEIGILGAEAEELRAFRELEKLDGGPFRLRRLANPGYRAVLYRFEDRVRPPFLAVSERTSKGEQACPFTDRARVSAGGLGGHATYPRERFRCSGGEPFFVGVTVIDDERYRPRRCIFAHPPRDGGVLVLTFSEVPAARAIHGHAGFPYLIFRDGVGAPVTLRAFVNGQPTGESVHRDEAGFTEFEHAIPEGDRAPGELRFEISSADSRAREFCFSADLR
jgi:hypothetical protein